MSRLKYLLQARAWDDAGRPDRGLVSDALSLTTLRCWVGRDRGGDTDPEEALIRAYADASVARMDGRSAGWYDAVLSMRSRCGRCGLGYRIENLALCSGCDAEICHRCITEPPSGPGRHAHACGGDLVG